MKMIPLLYAAKLPGELLEYCMDQEWSTHYDSDVVQVDLKDENPMATFLKEQGYEFSPEEIKRGWGYVALLGS